MEIWKIALKKAISFVFTKKVLECFFSRLFVCTFFNIVLAETLKTPTSINDNKIDDSGESWSYKIKYTMEMWSNELQRVFVK